MRPLGHQVWAITLPVAHIGVIVVAASAWESGWWVLTVLAWPLIVWLNHASLTCLHEAAHGTMSRWRPLNELQGVIIGTAALTPLSVYRYVHARHHAHLGRERDPEFWPYNLPGTWRGTRIAYAWIELLAGWIVTPLLYSVRTAMGWRHVPRRLRPRLIVEWAVLLAFWICAPVLIVLNGYAELAVVGFVIPAWGAGVFQTVRKFTEHLGMHGDTIMTMTRTVAYRRALGRLASASQLHVDHHGTHHRYARIPYYELPRATPRVYGEERLFRSHLEAIRDMLPHLLDPRIGPQWIDAASSDSPQD